MEECRGQAHIAWAQSLGNTTEMCTNETVNPSEANIDNTKRPRKVFISQ